MIRPASASILLFAAACGGAAASGGSVTTVVDTTADSIVAVVRGEGFSARRASMRPFFGIQGRMCFENRRLLHGIAENHSEIAGHRR